MRSPDPKIQTNSAGKLRLWKVSIVRKEPRVRHRAAELRPGQVTFTILFSQDAPKGTRGTLSTAGFRWVYGGPGPPTSLAIAIIRLGPTGGTQVRS